MHRLFLVPTLLINAVIILVPALLTIALAFFRWDGISTPVFIGLGNFQALWTDRVFWTALTNNLLWTAIFLVVPIALGMFAATLLLVARRGSMFFQVIYFLPMVIATAILDRLLHHSHVINIKGNSYRLKEHKQRKEVKITN